MVTESIGKSLTSFGNNFGKRVSERFDRVERQINDLETEATTTRGAVEKLEKMVAEMAKELELCKAAREDKHALEARVEGMATQLNEANTKIEERTGANAAASYASGSGSGNRDWSNWQTDRNPPYEQRTKAVLMNVLAPVANMHALPDEEKRIRRENCFNAGKALLEELQIPTDHFGALMSMSNGKGCTLEFRSHGELQNARSKVALANKSCGQSHDGRKIVCFLDCGKTRDELRPALLTHRAFDILVDIEKDRTPNNKEVVKDLKGKTIKVGGSRFGYSCYGQWKWTKAATDRYDEGELDAALCYINGH